ncbi:hypothetical protein GCM10022199_23240 [Marihabitans asiaticum]|uniref:Uncharacterized protein n=1 Tax=Marihabitans asiaticum TaxID=415218 RepID=A0A560W9Z7_9MICO|nr:hypothetical protein [Marihabitans asiaticum]TWD14454.1 hypothetical protein FB557_1864 [Marihabitans asiaticum]
MSAYGDVRAMDPDRVHLADAAFIRVRARQLDELADLIDTVGGLLRQVSTIGVWQSGSGDAFAAHVDDVPVTLRRITAQLRAAAEVLAAYAPRLTDRQDVLAEVARQHAAVGAAAEECDRRLATMASDHPAEPIERGRHGDLMNRLIDLEQRYLTSCGEAVAAEGAVAAELVDIGDQLTDPRGYDLFEGMRDLGRSSVVDNPVSWVVKPLALARVIDPLGQAGLKVFYGQGSWREIGKSSVTVGLDSAVKGSGWAVRRMSGIAHAATGAKGAKRAGVETGAWKAAERTASTKGAGARRTAAPGPADTRWAQVKARGQAWHGVGVDGARGAARWGTGKAIEAGRSKSGMQLADDVIADWTMVAGSSRVVRVAQGVNTVAKVGKQANGQVKTARTIGDTVGPREEDRASAATRGAR